MNFKNTIYILLSAFLLSYASTSCKKNSDVIRTSGGELSFSEDTVTFDTVFTSLGSFTTWVKIYNREDQRIKISSVKLLKGEASYFKLNVDGRAGNDIRDVEIAANDSIYVFATVKIDPNDDLTPFVVEDKLVATLNGREYAIPFMAYGQNANYVVDSVLETQTWNDKKPYVIIHNALVKKDNILTIAPGTRVYVHADSRLYVEGTLKAIGAKTDSIIFQGDRLDRKYFGNVGYPGEWGGMYFLNHSKDNELRHVILRNCGNSTRIGSGAASPAAIQVNLDSSGSTNYTLSMYNTRIENSIGYGILSFTGKVKAENCLIHTTGAQAVGVFQGGVYEFTNCTFANYGSKAVNHIDNPTVGILNYFEVSKGQFLVAPLYCTLTNCVAYGSLETEFVVDTVFLAGVPYECNVNNSLVKVKDGLPAHVKVKDCIVNPSNTNVFKNTSGFDFSPADGSPLIDKGTNVNVNTDIDNNPRTGAPDIGCYERK